MTGVEQAAVWLFAVFCAAVTVTSVAKSVASARVEVAKANAGAYVQAHRVVSEAQFGPTTLPAWMTKDGDQ
jgi:hypothetical protein